MQYKKRIVNGQCQPMCISPDTGMRRIVQVCTAMTLLSFVLACSHNQTPSEVRSDSKSVASTARERLSRQSASRRLSLWFSEFGRQGRDVDERTRAEQIQRFAERIKSDREFDDLVPFSLRRDVKGLFCACVLATRNASRFYKAIRSAMDSSDKVNPISIAISMLRDREDTVERIALALHLLEQESKDFRFAGHFVLVYSTLRVSSLDPRVFDFDKATPDVPVDEWAFLKNRPVDVPAILAASIGDAWTRRANGERSPFSAEIRLTAGRLVGNLRDEAPETIAQQKTLTPWNGARTYADYFRACGRGNLDRALARAVELTSFLP